MNGSSDSESEQPPTKIIKDYEQKYKKDWENEFQWIKISSKGEHYAYCKACCNDIRVTHGKSELIKHSKSAKHKKSLAAVIQQPSVSGLFSKHTAQKDLQYKIKEAEIRISGFIAEHNLPFKLMEHFPNLIRAVCPDSKIAEGIKCSRTKVKNLITNITGTEQKSRIINLMKENKFSIIADETTDRSCNKIFCLVVRFKNMTIEDHFLMLIDIVNATAAALFDCIINFFLKYNIPYKMNFIGFAADGANNMMGVNNSVASRLKQVLPNIFIMKCICHTFHLCASYACKTLPQELEQVTREVYNYFANSLKRINEYKQFQEFAKVSPVKILHPSQTRWLSLLGVVKRLLSQYNALVLFFTDQSNENITQAKNILDILVKPQTKLYLEFLAYILPTFHNLSLVMQSESPKIHLIYKEVSLAVKTILECYVLEEKIENASFSDTGYENPHNFLKIEHMYFGVSIQASTYNEHILHEVKATCLAFYVEAVKQILTRFPLKDSIFAHLEFIDPQVVISRRITSIAHIAQYFPSLGQDWQTVDNEWRQLRNWDIKNSIENENASEFWRQVGEIKLGNGEKKFAHLVDLVFNLLCLPHSSANVERIFSQVNLNKTTTRNKLKTNTLEGLLHTKNLVSKNYNCFNFPISSDLVKKSTSSALYATDDAASSSNAISTNSDDDIEIE